MKLSSLLNENLIVVGSAGSNKVDIIKELIEMVAESYPNSLPKEILSKSVFERENLGGTTFPSGIAIPHARLDQFDDLIIAIAIPKAPFVENQITITMVVLILTASNKPALYLNCLSAFARLSQDKNLYPKLLQVRNANEFIDLLEDSPYQVKTTVLVENVMNANIKGVQPETKLKEINDILFENKLSYLPVISENGELVGEIRFFNIMELGIPDYARNMGTLSFTSSLESFENLISKEDKITAKEIMNKPQYTLSPKATLLEAAALMLQLHDRQIAVVDGKKLVGVISYMDILNKIIRN